MSAADLVATRHEVEGNDEVRTWLFSVRASILLYSFPSTSLPARFLVNFEVKVAPTFLSPSMVGESSHAV